MQRTASLIFGALIALAAVVFVWYDAWAWNQAAKRVDSKFRQLATATAGNERPGGIYLEADSYYWMGYARRIGNGEALRIRHTDADNAPYGRSVHWSQSISWLLVIFGKTRQAITGEGWSTALEQGSVWLNPCLLTLLVCSLGWALFRRTGLVPAALFMAYLVTPGDVGWAFQPLRPGHQTLHCLLGLFMLAGLALGGAGWFRITNSHQAGGGTFAGVRPLEIPNEKTATRWFIASGLSAAASLWVSAVVSTMLFGLLFGAALVLTIFAPSLGDEGSISVKPELWRWWGWIAGGGSFLFYLLEYFPFHLSLFRLEVNGPLYSVGAVAMGEALCQFLRARYASGSLKSAARTKGWLCTVVVILVPLGILFGPQSWHALRDPVMQRLHNVIYEFYSLPRFAGSNLGHLFIQNFGILPLFILVAIALAAFADLRVEEWSALWLSFVATLGMLGFGYLQVRWLGLFVALNAWLAVVTGVCAWRSWSGRLSVQLRTFVGIGFVTLLLIQPVLFARTRMIQVGDIIEQRSVPKQLVDPVLNKRLALSFLAEEGPGARVMSDPDFAPALQYFGEGSSVVSFYWENLAGLHAATEFFADKSDGEVAKQIARDRKLTHVLVCEGNRLQIYSYYLATGKVDQEAAKTDFAAHLVGNEFTLPGWLLTTPALQRIGYQVYAYGEMPVEERWRLYRISPQD